jgi:hypothetical protein
VRDFTKGLKSAFTKEKIPFDKRHANAIYSFHGIRVKGLNDRKEKAESNENLSSYFDDDDDE